jgi:hypothetical protein
MRHHGRQLWSMCFGSGPATSDLDGKAADVHVHSWRKSRLSLASWTQWAIISHDGSVCMIYSESATQSKLVICWALANSEWIKRLESIRHVYSWVLTDGHLQQVGPTHQKTRRSVSRPARPDVWAQRREGSLVCKPRHSSGLSKFG